MSQTVKPALSDIEIRDIEGLEKTDIDLRFEIAALKLNECAMHVPGIDLDKDKEVAELESQLLYLQEDILEKTSKIEIKSDLDYKQTKNLWRLAKGMKLEKDLNILDQLALSLFQYLEQKT